MLFCHFARFDFEVIREFLDEFGYEFEFFYNGSRFISAKIRSKDKGRSLWIVDSMNFYPMALQKVGKIVHVDKLERPDYLGVRMPDISEMKYFKKYALVDAVIVYKAMDLIRKEFSDMRCTLASTTLNDFRKN